MKKFISVTVLLAFCLATAFATPAVAVSVEPVLSGAEAVVSSVSGGAQAELDLFASIAAVPLSDVEAKLVEGGIFGPGPTIGIFLAGAAIGSILGIKKIDLLKPMKPIELPKK